MKKILVIDESPLFRDYLTKKFEEKGFEVVEGRNGLDGSVKLRNEMPDLIVTDFYLSRKGALELLEEKKNNPNVAEIPLIIVASKVDRTQLMQAARYDVKKFFSKPVRMDVLLKTVAQLLKVEVEIDSTPCIIEAHLNDQILFIEVARGLNTEKIELLRYKIAELLDLYEITYPRVLVMMSDLELSAEDEGKFRTLLDTIIEYAGPYARHMKILTRSEYVEKFISGESKYRMIGVADNLNKAMDDLLGLKPDDVAHDEVVRERLLSTSNPKKEKDETFQLRFDGGGSENSQGNRGLEIAVVDDDAIIRQLVQTVFAKTGWSITGFNNGKEFIENIGDAKYDLVYLDLMMPEMDGFQVLAYMKKHAVEFPVIVLSALSQQETVVKAMRFGVRSFLIKPLKPKQLLTKTAEILNTNF